MIQRLVGLSIALTTCAAAAQSLSPAPLAGLWESSTKIRINGQDMLAQMRQMQQEMLKNLPPAQRAQVEAMMGGRGGMPGQGPRRQCITREEIARSTNPRTALEDLQRDAPECRFEPVQAAGSTMTFRGRCNDPDGFTGDVAGRWTIESDKAVRFTYEGQGRMKGAEAMPGMAAGGPVTMQVEGTSRWLAADCGNVKPAPR